MPRDDALQAAIEEALLAAGAPENRPVTVVNDTFGQDSWRLGDATDANAPGG